MTCYTVWVWYPHGRGHLLLQYVRANRQEAIKAFMKDNKRFEVWASASREGFKTVRVRLEMMQ